MLERAADHYGTDQRFRLKRYGAPHLFPEGTKTPVTRCGRRPLPGQKLLPPRRRDPGICVPCRKAYDAKRGGLL